MIGLSQHCRQRGDNQINLLGCRLGPALGSLRCTVGCVPIVAASPRNTNTRRLLVDNIMQRTGRVHYWANQ